MPVKKSSFIIVLTVLLIAFLAACQTTQESMSSVEAGISVNITDDLCPNVEIQVGQQISWTNAGSQNHVVSATSNTGTGQFESGTLQPKDSFVFTFTEAGSYAYVCSVDSANAATGTITVQP